MDKPPPRRATLAQGVIVVLVLLCAGLGAVLVVRRIGSGPAQDAAPSGPTFLNASGDVAYTGVAGCAACHDARHASWRETPHSRSLATVVPSSEPLPADYEHPASALRYRIRAEDGAMRIAESLLLEDGETAVLADHAVKYGIGSGARSRSYLADVEGFLVQAPVTYFAAPQAWSISPGFDRSLHMGFGRPVGTVCLACHAGSVESLRGSVNRVRLHEEAIGCERCHGPGALHDAARRKPGATQAGEDLTIVNPRRLSREQAMDLCAQCHMDDTLTVTNPGKSGLEWRPSMPWNEIHVTYRPAAPWKEMTAVGHVDPLRQSACFKGSDTLTCLTCHDPHVRPPTDAAARRSHFNGKCLTCHDACGRTPDAGSAPVSPADDDCTGCHMPRNEEAGAHVARTSHRIARPGPLWEPVTVEGVPDLEPRGDVTHLPPLVRKRNLALAYLRLAAREPYPKPVYFAVRQRAKALIEEARKEGLEDPEIDAALARIRHDERQREEACDLARAALEHRGAAGMSPQRRCDCLAFLVEASLQDHQLDEARALLEELGTLRRDAYDVMQWVTLLREEGDLEGALAAAKRGLAIWPENPEFQYLAAGLYEASGNLAARDLHNRIGQRIHLQQSRRPEPPK